LLDANTYSVEKYYEAGTVVEEYNELLSKAEKISSALSAEYKDAYFQLVLHPVKACANLNELYYNVALNRNAYKNKYAIANEYADKVKQLYINDSLITIQYDQLGNGKWNHMMDQTHIGYTYWQQPPRQKMPDVRYVPKDSIIPPPQRLVTDEESSVVPPNEKGNAFFETEGYVSIEADHFTNAINTNGITWKILPDHGRTGNAVTTFPVTSTTQKLTAASPHLEYVFYTYSADTFKLNAYFSPSLNFHNTETGLQYAVSIDDELPQITGINKEDNNVGTWGRWVANNIIIKTTSHKISKPGRHVVKYWVIDPGVVLQKIVIDFGGVKPSYLGPPETRSK